MPADKPYAVGEHPDGQFRSWLNRPVTHAVPKHGAAAFDSVGYHSGSRRKTAALVAEFPEQCSILAACRMRGLTEGQMKLAVAKHASTSPERTWMWRQYLTKLAAQPPGVPQINATQANPSSGLPGPKPAIPAKPQLNPATVGDDAPGPVMGAINSAGSALKNTAGGALNVGLKGIGRVGNMVRGGAYTGAGLLGTAASGIGSIGAEGLYQTGLMGKPNRDAMHAFTGTYAKAIPAGLHDMTVQPFTGTSAVTDMNNANVANLQRMAPNDTVLGFKGREAGNLVNGADFVGSMAANLATPMGMARGVQQAGTAAKALGGASGLFNAASKVPGAGRVASGIGAVANYGAQSPIAAAAGLGTRGISTAAGIGSMGAKMFPDAISTANSMTPSPPKPGMAPPSTPEGTPSVDPERPGGGPAGVGPIADQPAAPPTPQNPAEAAGMQAGNAAAAGAAAGSFQPLPAVTGDAIARMSPEEAVQRGAAADERAGQLVQQAQQMDPAQLKAAAPEMESIFKDKIAAHAKQTGTDPAGLLSQAQTGELGKSMGLGQQFAQMEPWQQVLTAVGVPLALSGIASQVFGGGEGMGGMLMTILGIGGAAAGLGAFGGQGPLSGVGGQLADLFGGGQPGATPQPAPAAPAAAGPGIAGGVAAGPAAGASGSGLAVGRGAPPAPAAAAAAPPPTGIKAMLGDGRIDANERAALMQDPAMRAGLVNGSPQERAEALRGMMAGDPGFGSQLEAANGAMSSPFKRPFAYSKARGMGIQPNELDAMIQTYRQMQGGGS